MEKVISPRRPTSWQSAMANFKRKKSRRNVRCNLCTDARDGNSKKGGGRKSRISTEIATRSERKRIERWI